MNSGIKQLFLSWGAIPLLLGSLIAASGAGSLSADEYNVIGPPETWSLPPARTSLVCRATTETIVIDGVLDEAAWAEADAIGFLKPVDLAAPLSPTIGRVCWDENYLYVAFEASDYDLKAVIDEHDGPVYRDDVLETFLQPPLNNSALYFNFEINIMGTLHDARRLTPFADYTCGDLEIGIDLLGTLNDSSDRDEGVRMEVAIPFACLGEPLERATGGAGENAGETANEGVYPLETPTAGDVWKFHLARYDYAPQLPNEKELTSTAPLSAVNFHKPEDWIELRFE